MSLNEKIAAFLASVDVQHSRSKLEPYGELIRALRRKRWGYRRIAAALQEQFGVHAAASSIHSYLKFRAKRKPSACELAPTINGPAIAPQAIPSAPTPKRPRFNLDA
jgi:hypothetical protein